MVHQKTFQIDFEKLLYMVHNFDYLNVNKTLFNTKARKAKYDIFLGLYKVEERKPNEAD